MNRRSWLWTLFLCLLGALLIALVWLIGRYEQSRFEEELERNATQITHEIRAKLTKNIQLLQITGQSQNAAWTSSAQQLLAQHPEMRRIERRSTALATLQTSDSPFFHNTFALLGRTHSQADVAQACQLAARLQEPAYGGNYFVPSQQGIGYEVVDLCLPIIRDGQLLGYTVVSYVLEGWLKEWAQSQAQQGQEISFVEADGARLAIVGRTIRNGLRFSAQALLDLPGNTLIVRIESWQTTPHWLVNIPFAFMLLLSSALAMVLWLLRRDVRRRLRAEESLRLSQEKLQRVARLASLGEMASMLSHELNQPLAAITSYAEGSLNLLAAPAFDKADVQTALMRIADQSARAGQVIKSIRDFVRLRETERVVISPQALFDAVLPLLKLQAKLLGVRLQVEVSTGLLDVWCDKILIEQVLINLVKNGLQATPKGGLLTLKALPSGPNLVEFHVADTGHGLAPDVAQQLFTPFFTTKDEGTGLGLSLCRTVIEQHGGELSYITSAHGTTFKFKLMKRITSPEELRYAAHH